jgi:hypothetical protein
VKAFGRIDRFEFSTRFTLSVRSRNDDSAKNQGFGGGTLLAVHHDAAEVFFWATSVYYDTP